MIDISTTDQENFNSDGFLIVDSLIESSIIPELHQAFTDLFRGKFETGVRPDPVARRRLPYPANC